MFRLSTRLGLAGSLAASAIFLAAGCSSDSTTTPGPTPDANNPGDITTYAGTGIAGLGPDGLAPEQTAFYTPQDLTFDENDKPYIIDFNNHRVRTIQGGVIQTVIGTGEIGEAPEGIATDVNLNHPTNIAFDPQGTLILAAWHNSKVMKLDFSTGMLTRFAGDGSRAFAGDGGPALTCKLDLPVGVAVDPVTGEVYISDEANVRIRKIDTSGNIQTICGNGTRGYSGDNGPAIAAQLNLPAGQSAPAVGRIAYANGSVYIADYLNHCIRRIDTASGIITTIAGNGTPGYSGDGGLATAAQLKAPADVDVASNGDVYIADTYNSVIRKVDSSGIITTVAGVAYVYLGDGSVHFSGDGGPATSAHLDRPHGIALDSEGNLYIADTYNNRIRKVWK
jgi:DNA-binding beta-propeller fold protein YncE